MNDVINTLHNLLYLNPVISMTGLSDFRNFSVTVLGEL
jgi:hypothetical protein